MGAIKELRKKNNVSDSQVRKISLDEFKDTAPQLAKDQWTYKGKYMKPLSRDIRYVPPANPECKVCLDKGTVWKKVNDRGRSRLQDCECKMRKVS